MPKGYKKDGSPIGGKRLGAGRTPEYNEKTTTVSARCPISKKEELTAYIELKLKGWRIDI